MASQRREHCLVSLPARSYRIPGWSTLGMFFPELLGILFPSNLSASISKALIKYRASDRDLRLVENILRHLKSRYVYLSYEEHDEVTANTQAVTHAAFLR